MFHTFVKLTDIIFDCLTSVVKVGHFSSPMHIVVLKGTTIYVILSFLDAIFSISDVIIE